MKELLGKVDEPGIIDCSCLLKGKDVIVSSFSKSKRNHETIAKQTFSYIFLNVAKQKTKHNEAHLEIGGQRLSGFLLKPGLVLVCLSDKSLNITKVRSHIQHIKHLILQSEVDKMLA